MHPRGPPGLGPAAGPLTAAQLALLAAAGLFAGWVNTLAGGGSLVSLPALILLGDLPATVANGTNRVAVVVQSATAAAGFRAGGMLAGRTALRLLVPTCLGAVLGAMASVDLDDARFERVIGVAMLLMLAVVLARPRRWLEGGRRLPGWLSFPLFFAAGAYGGFLQAGVGIFLLAGLVLVEGLDLVRGNAVKVVLVLGFTLIPLAIFLRHDLVAWLPGLVLAAGSAAGGWLGSKTTLRWGAPLVRWVLAVVVVLSSLRLLGAW